MRLVGLLKEKALLSLILRNVNKSSSTKRALLSYTLIPFLRSNVAHTNAQESKAIVSALSELGYSVDVVNYTCRRRINYSDYSLILGFGHPFENSFDYSRKLLRICYMTGAHYVFQNYAELHRVKEVNQRRSVSLSAKRLVPWAWDRSIALSDAIIVIGNAWTLSTYQSYTDVSLYPINATSKIVDSANRSKGRHLDDRKAFLWFGSTGLVHKGLDLCVEYFSRNENVDLHICGPKENDFFNTFERELNSDNIYYHGFVDVGSEQYLDLTQRCNFVLLPTCSEGQATSLLTVMGNGLVPLSTKQSGIDVDRYGIEIEDLTVADVGKAVEAAAQMSENEYRDLSEKSSTSIVNHHSIDLFRENLKSILIAELS